MSKLINGAVLAAIVATSTVVPTSADARRHYYHSARCHRSDGTTGTIIGAGGGALAGAAIGGGVAAPIIGGAAGALLGRHIDRKKVICR